MAGLDLRQYELLNDGNFLRKLLESSGDWISVLDGQGSIEFINRGGLELLEVAEPAKLIGSDWHLVFDSSSRELARLAFAEAGSRGKVRFAGDVVTASGRAVTFDAEITAIDGLAGKYLMIARDISELKASEEHSKLLMAELLHRGKNLLSLVQAIANQTFRGDAATERKGNEFSDRLRALARVNDDIGIGGLDGTTIRSLIESAIDVMEKRASIFIDGPELTLTRQQSQILALAIHELLTNALKYGSLSTDNGEVRICWSDDGSVFALEWAERGGPKPEPALRQGFGTTLLERVLPQSFGGKVKVDLDPRGLSFRLVARSPRSRRGY